MSQLLPGMDVYEEDSQPPTPDGAAAPAAAGAVEQQPFLLSSMSTHAEADFVSQVAEAETAVRRGRAPETLADITPERVLTVSYDDKEDAKAAGAKCKCSCLEPTIANLASCLSCTERRVAVAPCSFTHPMPV